MPIKYHVERIKTVIDLSKETDIAIGVARNKKAVTFTIIPKGKYKTGEVIPKDSLDLNYNWFVALEFGNNLKSIDLLIEALNDLKKRVKNE